jgi:hypothetical protein
MKKSISRRDFLKYSVQGAMGGFFYLHAFPKIFTLFDADASAPLMGRVFKDNTVIYQEPSFSAGVKYHLTANSVLSLAGEVIGDPINAHSKLWYEASDDGYIPANSLQPVRQHTNLPKTKINSAGELGTVTVPYTKAWLADPSSAPEKYLLLFYGSTHWVKKVYTDAKGDTYYKIIEDRWGDAYYVQAEHVAIMQSEELAAFADAVPDAEKLLEVNIADQTVSAYEYGKMVFFSLASTGVLTDEVDLSTPPGEYAINYKRPSRHMVHTDKSGGDDGELYGVPWVTYFTNSGIAFHGTYWHNDFGVQRSHGCVNLPIPAAKWVYLWSRPAVPFGQEKFVSNTGTKAIVS